MELSYFKKLIIQYKFILFFTFITLICLILGLFLFRNDNLKPEHIKNGSNICVCMWYDEGVREYSDIAKEINIRYCNLHKYDFIYDNIRRLPDRKPHWERIPLIKKILNEYNYDYVIWIDSDAFFRKNNSILLENIINKYNKEIIFSEDINNGEKHNSIINSGIIILKNTEYTKKILDYWSKKECFDKRIDREFEDQGCIRYTHKENIYNLKDRSIILPFGELQTFKEDEHNNSLIIHLAGIGKEKRIKIITKYRDKYNI